MYNTKGLSELDEVSEKEWGRWDRKELLKREGMEINKSNIQKLVCKQKQN